MTEEGKRCASKIGRSARGQVRLPSSVTLPPTFSRNKTTAIPNRFDRGKHHRRQCATFSSGEGFGARGKRHQKQSFAMIYCCSVILSPILSNKKRADKIEKSRINTDFFSILSNKELFLGSIGTHGSGGNLRRAYKKMCRGAPVCAPG